MSQEQSWEMHIMMTPHIQTLDGGAREALCPSGYLLLDPNESVFAPLCLLGNREQTHGLFGMTYLGHMCNRTLVKLPISDQRGLDFFIFWGFFVCLFS